MTDADDIAFALAAICLHAGVPVMNVYANDFMPEQKADRSPVTEADRLAEAVILDWLKRLMPGVPVLAEESFAAGVRPETGARFLLVDPVDGTREFIDRNGEFTINIALVEHGVPVAGCVYAPALGQIYAGGRRAFTAAATPGADIGSLDWRPIRTRAAPKDGLVALTSRSRVDEAAERFAREHGAARLVPTGSSLKFCKIAEGAADLYPRFGATMEWDIAAGHAVLAAAGGAVTTPGGDPFTYGKADAGYQNGPFVAWGRAPAG
ncbi:MAG: 3'(2'),5'-bisphosphate nucleotidase CysQ [Oceanicaulis sp.]